jgi:hypothetical protein
MPPIISPVRFSMFCRPASWLTNSTSTSSSGPPTKPVMLRMLHCWPYPPEWQVDWCKKKSSRSHNQWERCSAGRDSNPLDGTRQNTIGTFFVTLSPKPLFRRPSPRRVPRLRIETPHLSAQARAYTALWFERLGLGAYSYTVQQVQS